MYEPVSEGVSLLLLVGHDSSHSLFDLLNDGAAETLRPAVIGVDCVLRFLELSEVQVELVLEDVVVI